MKYPCEFLFQILYIVRFMVSRKQETSCLQNELTPVIINTINPL
jgi:hypothetical protein